MVLGVVLLLSGIAIPMISSYVDDGKRARAEAEVKMLTAAVTAFYKDAGRYPARNSSGADNFLYTLVTGETQPTSNPFAAGHAFYTWGANSTRGDTLDNHLLRNTPKGQTSAAYPVTGNVRWRGPYLSGPAPLDPWGRPYIISVIGSWFTHATQYKRMYILSAGPDGRINTSATSTSTSNVEGDDIGVIVVERI